MEVDAPAVMEEVSEEKATDEELEGDDNNENSNRSRSGDGDGDMKTGEEESR